MRVHYFMFRHNATYAFRIFNLVKMKDIQIMQLDILYGISLCVKELNKICII